jgi:hypothetical protein
MNLDDTFYNVYDITERPLCYVFIILRFIVYKRVLYVKGKVLACALLFSG